MTDEESKYRNIRLRFSCVIIFLELYHPDTIIKVVANSRTRDIYVGNMGCYQ